MRDEQTGSYRQQITGDAIAGPLAGKKLKLVAADELSFKLWKAEEPTVRFCRTRRATGANTHRKTGT
jgi:hypothetical protein